VRPDYLRIDEFMRDLAGARSLTAAFELGVVDVLAGGDRVARPRLAERASLDASGLDLLVGLLRAGRIVAEDAEGVRLTAEFAAALRYRDLLEAKLDFAKAVAGDFVERFELLLARPGRFFEEAALFRLFSYDRCFDPTPANRAATERWMRITTALTRHEAPVLLDRVDLGPHRRLLDVGGNSGELALQACRRNAALRAVVFDLPLVCDIGEEHLRGEPEAGRIEFRRSRSTAEVLPEGMDAVFFKSMLHDWPDDETRAFLARACRALQPGGRLVIFERCAFGVPASGIPYSMLPLMLFFRSYRTPERYRELVAAAGFRDIRIERIELDMPFLLLEARR
jgi:SAM-dependent methyltransferase